MRIDKIKTIALWEYRNRVRSKAFLLSVILPFIIMALAVIPQIMSAKKSPEKIRTAVFCENREFRQEFISRMDSTYRLPDNSPLFIWAETSAPAMDAEESAVREILEEGIAEAVLRLDATDADSVHAYIYYENAGSESLRKLRNGVQRTTEYIRIIRADIDPEIVSQIRKPVAFSEFRIDSSGQISESNLIFRYLVPFVFMFVLVMGIITTSQMMVSSIIEERSQRIVEMLLTSVRPPELMTGKILGMGMLGLTQILIYVIILFGSGSRFLPEEITSAGLSSANLPWYFLFFILGYLLFSSIYAAIGVLFDNEKDAQQIGGILSLTAVVPIYFISFMLEHPESSLTAILSFIPLITPFLMIARVGLLNIPPLQTACMAVYLMIWIAVIIRLAAGIFRIAILMYGKRPSLPEIIKMSRNLSEKSGQK